MATALPTGIVTFLFTDVEGSTTLLQQLGDENYAQALAEHRALLRDAFAAHDGIEVDTQGDAFFCVFTLARDAVACAHEAQKRLTATPMRVRIGLHSGEALVEDDHYVGLEVHRAARIAASGHGGQVLLSSATAPLLEPDSFPLHDLGEHRLKDLSAPIRIFQLGGEKFPPLRTLHRTNLPIPATPFLGREHELETVLALAGTSRLLTLTGPGGTGKTRLALQVAGELADEFAGGVFWVPLASLRQQSHVGSAIASALGVEESAGDIAESIADAVSAQTLLLLDNCEHLLEGVASFLSPLLNRAESLRVITTSREPLALAGEHVVQVDPLERSDAIALFVARADAAGAHDLDRGAVASLCERLDDLPLGIELAAARTPALPPSVLLERLSQRLDLLRGARDADERQRTLEATIAWSYDLLTEEEQRVFCGMSLFVGGASLAAVEHVVDADVGDLVSLVAKNLVRMTATTHGPRYWMLETIREFAGAQTAYGEQLRARFVEWFGRLAAEAGPELGERHAVQWLERLDADVGNLRTAFTLALESGVDEAAVLGTTLVEFHTLRGRYAEAHETVTETLASTSTPMAAAKLDRLLGTVLVRRGELAAAAASYAAAEELLVSLDDRDEHWWREWLELKLDTTLTHYWAGDVTALHDALDELQPDIERHGTPRQRASFLGSLMLEALRRERYAASENTEKLARAYWDAAQAVGDWDGHFQLGFVLLWRDKLDEARGYFRLGRDEARAAGDALFEIRCLIYEAMVERKLDDLEAVRVLDAEIDQLEDTYGYRSLIAAGRAWLAWRAGDLDAAEALGALAVADWKSESRSGATVFQWSARFPLLAVDVERGRLESASAHARVMLDESQQPLRPDVREAVDEALRSGSRTAFVRAIDIARNYGYT